jgi:hypothetical protein
MSTELVRRAAAGDFSPEVAAWLAQGMRRHLAGAIRRCSPLSR